MTAQGLRAAGVEQAPRGVQVGVQAQVEVGFTFARHRRGQVEHGVPTLGHQGGDVRQQVARVVPHARVGQQGCIAWGHQVGQHQLRDGLTAQRAGLQQGAGESVAEEAGAAGDEDLHAIAFCEDW
ncbi:hypothetical protein D9M68_821490 [compost metagenome]